MEPTPLNTDMSARLKRQRVAIIDGSAELLDWLEPTLTPGSYDVLFLDANDDAYSQVKTVHPDLVVLTMRIEDVDAFRLLTMLKLDEETSTIPVVTYTTEYEGQPIGRPVLEPADDARPTFRPVLPLN
jgi:PleD family two-component response regulator